MNRKIIVSFSLLVTLQTSCMRFGATSKKVIPTDVISIVMKHADLQANISLIKTCIYLYNKYNNQDNYHNLIPERPMEPHLFCKALIFFSEKNAEKARKHLFKVAKPHDILSTLAGNYKSNDVCIPYKKNDGLIAFKKNNIVTIWSIEREKKSTFENADITIIDKIYVAD